ETCPSLRAPFLPPSRSRFHNIYYANHVRPRASGATGTSLRLERGEGRGRARNWRERGPRGGETNPRSLRLTRGRQCGPRPREDPKIRFSEWPRHATNGTLIRETPGSRPLGDAPGSRTLRADPPRRLSQPGR